MNITNEYEGGIVDTIQPPPQPPGKLSSKYLKLVVQAALTDKTIDEMDRMCGSQGVSAAERAYMRSLKHIKRGDKRKNEGTFDGHADDTVVRFFEVEGVFQENYYFVIISDPSDTQILEFILCGD